MNNTIQKAIICAAIIFICPSLFAQQNQAQLTYIETYKEIAIKEMQRTGVLASITLAQGLLESRHGTSQLAAEGRNHFGIKCPYLWNGPGIQIYDDDTDAQGNRVTSCFMVFNTVEESFIAHSDFLRNPQKSHYDFLFKLDESDYKGWARGLKKAGYATDPRYADKLISLIERYNLQQYDVDNVADNPSNPSSPSTAVHLIYLHVNDIPCILTKGGESLEMIAQKTGVSLRKLIHYNDDIQDAYPLMNKDQIVFLKPKKWNNSVVNNQYHIVGHGETMISISQEYGIQLARLYAKNKMSTGMEPSPGSSIKLSGTKAGAAPEVRNESQIADNNTEEYIQWDDEPRLYPEKAIIIERPVKQYFPQLTTEKEIYTVKKGDTLWSISQKHQLSVNELKNNNNLENNHIRVGQEIKLGRR